MNRVVDSLAAPAKSATTPSPWSSPAGALAPVSVDRPPREALGLLRRQSPPRRFVLSNCVNFGVRRSAVLC
jgi:hypothetical protein